jgi:hypothetical protein
MNNLRQKIELRMQIIEKAMKMQMHLIDPDTVEMLLERVEYCWGVLSEEDQDYIHGCQHALEEQIEWRVDE